MTKFPVLVGIGLLVFLMSCSGSGESMTAGTVEDSLGLDRSPLSKAADMFSAAQPQEVVVEREVVREVAMEAADMFSAAQPQEVVVEREVVKEVAVEAAMQKVAGPSELTALSALPALPPTAESPCFKWRSGR